MIIYYTHGYTGEDGESRKLLEVAIAEYTGDPGKAAELASRVRESGNYGKPVIDGFDGYSVSHSGNTWAVLFCSGPCGLDVQYERETDIGAVTRRFYGQDEAEAVQTGGRNEFFRIWARREALVKAAGESIVNSELPAVLAGKAVYCGETWYIQDVEIPGENLYAAVCCGSPGEKAEVRELER